MPIKLQTTKFTWTGGTSNQFDVHDPKPMYMLGNFTFRAYQYLHIELNETHDAGTMRYLEYHGYMYGDGVIFGCAGYYPYGPSGGPIAIHKNKFGAGNINSYALDNIGVTGNNKVWLRFNRNNSGYTEGGITIFFSENDPPNTRRHSVSQKALNNSSSSPF